MSARSPGTITSVPSTRSARKCSTLMAATRTSRTSRCRSRRLARTAVSAPSAAATLPRSGCASSGCSASTYTGALAVLGLQRAPPPRRRAPAARGSRPRRRARSPWRPERSRATLHGRRGLARAMPPSPPRAPGSRARWPAGRSGRSRARARSRRSRCPRRPRRRSGPPAPGRPPRRASRRRADEPPAIIAWASASDSARSLGLDAVAARASARSGDRSREPRRTIGRKKPTRSTRAESISTSPRATIDLPLWGSSAVT